MAARVRAYPVYHAEQNIVHAPVPIWVQPHGRATWVCTRHGKKSSARMVYFTHCMAARVRIDPKNRAGIMS